jgi:hypothetical protein
MEFFPVYPIITGQMGRPRKQHPSTPVEIQASPKLLAYLDILIRKEAYGGSRPEVAKQLCWRMIEEPRQ